MDLQGHMVEEHGTAMTTRDKKAAMHLETDFQFEEIGGGRGRGRGRRGEREPPPQPVARPAGAGGGGGGGRRREGFRPHLTGSGDNSATVTPNRRQSPSPTRRRTPSPPTDVDPVVAEYASCCTVLIWLMTSCVTGGTPAF
jgi:E3 ubiquitin-protein ligase ZNF598